MSTPHDDLLAHGPYRVSLPLPVPPPPQGRASVIASYVLSACALVATLTSLHVATTLTRLVPASAPHHVAMRVQPAAVVVPPPAAEVVKAARPTGYSVIDGIRPLGRGVYLLTRDAIDAALGDQRQLMGRTRILPEMRDGRVVGVRVFGIQPGDLLAALGFANGDVIRAINGFDIGSPEPCLEPYSRLHPAREVTVTFERNGRARSYLYAIVDGALGG